MKKNKSKDYHRNTDSFDYNSDDEEFHIPLSSRLPQEPHHNPLLGRIVKSQIEIRFGKPSSVVIADTNKEMGSNNTKHGIERIYYPCQAPIDFMPPDTNTNKSSIIYYNLKLSPLARPLRVASSSQLNRDVVNACSDINVHFANPSASEFLGSDARKIISRLSKQSFSPHRFVWRLAALYVTASWAEANRDALKATHKAADLYPINSITSFSDALLTCYSDHNTDSHDGSKTYRHQPIVFDSDDPASDTRNLLPIIALAASADPTFQTSKRLSLPSISKRWPPLPEIRVYFTGSCETIPSSPSVITAETALKAANIWCKKHGCQDLLLDYIDTISILWTSTDTTKSPIFDSDELQISLPPLDTTPTLLIPIALTDKSPTRSPLAERRLEALYTFDSHTLLCRGVTTRLLLTFLMRVSTTETAKDEIGHIFSSWVPQQPQNKRSRKSQSKGDHREATIQRTIPNFEYLEPLAWILGYSGHLGHGIKSLTPIFSSPLHLEAWWNYCHTALNEASSLFPDTFVRLNHIISLKK